MSNRIEGLHGNFSISRRSDDMIYIRLRDAISRNEFVEVGVSPVDFAMAITGLSEVPCKLTVNNLAAVGMRKESESRQAKCPLNTYDRSVLRQWLYDNCAEEGWKIDGYLGSQGSIVHSGDVLLLNYRVYRYVPVAEGESPCE